MVLARFDEQLVRYSHFLELCSDPLGLLQRHQFVRITVQQQRRCELSLVT